jgi:hypothetical protein
MKYSTHYTQLDTLTEDDREDDSPDEESDFLRSSGTDVSFGGEHATSSFLDGAYQKTQGWPFSSIQSKNTRLDQRGTNMVSSPRVFPIAQSRRSPTKIIRLERM